MNLIVTEKVLCDICRSDKRRRLFTGKGSTGDAAIVRCLGCGLVYRSERRKDDDIFSGYSSQKFPVLSKPWMEGRKNVFRPYLDFLLKFKKTGRILDVGAGL